jgi:alpha/beta superfamily hydrolase
VLSGFSFGGYVAARAAQQLQPQHLILAAPAVGRFAMPAVSPDTLVVHGEHDDVVPLADALDWARPQHLPVVVLPAAEHFFHGRLTQLRDIVKKHFSGVEL